MLVAEIIMGQPDPTPPDPIHVHLWLIVCLANILHTYETFTCIRLLLVLYTLLQSVDVHVTSHYLLNWVTHDLSGQVRRSRSMFDDTCTYRVQRWLRRSLVCTDEWNYDSTSMAQWRRALKVAEEQQRDVVDRWHTNELSILTVQGQGQRHKVVSLS